MGNYYQALLHKLRGEPQHALASLKTVLGLNPSFAPAYANVAHIMSRIGSLDEAREHVRYAIRLSPRDPSLGNWSLYGGEIELELGNVAASIDWFRRATALNPQSPFNHAALAAALVLQGDRDAARTHMRQLKSLAPWLTFDRIERRLLGLSTGGRAPHRLIEGLRAAFNANG
jgi:tetratricopeptide (TPR) repeat protein